MPIAREEIVRLCRTMGRLIVVRASAPIVVPDPWPLATGASATGAAAASTLPAERKAAINIEATLLQGWAGLRGRREPRSLQACLRVLAHR